MKNIKANKKLTAKNRFNSISNLQIHWDKFTKDIGLLSGSIPFQVDLEAYPTSRFALFKVLADKIIGLEIELKEEEQNKQYKDVLKKCHNRLVLYRLK